MSNIIVPGQPPTQPTFPATQVNVTPQGWVITISFAPTLAFTHMISREDVAQLINIHNNMLQQEQMMARVAKHAVETKL